MSESSNTAQVNDSQEKTEELARKHGNRTRRKVMDVLLKEDYIHNIKQEIRVNKRTVEYHIDELRADGLVEKTGNAKNRTYYQLTPLGEEVLSLLNVPKY